MSDLNGIDTLSLLAHLGALGQAAVHVSEDDDVLGANDRFWQQTGIASEDAGGRKFSDLMEAMSAENQSFGDGMVYRFTGKQGDRWLRPRRGAGSCFSIVTLADVTSEWATIARLVSSIEVRVSFVYLQKFTLNACGDIPSIRMFAPAQNTLS